MIEDALRATSHMTQTEAARALGVGQSVISRWRSGERKPLRLATKRALLTYLRITEAPDDWPAYDLPDVSFLKDRARVFYEAKLGSVVQRRWPRESVERAAKEIGRRVRQAREARGLTRDDLARGIDVHPGSVARWETGGSAPQPEYLERIAEATGVTAAWIATGAEADPDDASALADWLLDFERAVRYVGGREDLDDAERRARQHDIVNGMIEARRQRGAEVPAALYALLGRLERDEL